MDEAGKSEIAETHFGLINYCVLIVVGLCVCMKVRDGKKTHISGDHTILMLGQPTPILASMCLLYGFCGVSLC